MIQVVLIIHLLLAIALVAVVLLQRSEGGALGMGGGSTMGGMMTTRGTATADPRHGGPGGLFYRDQPYACDPVVVQ